MEQITIFLNIGLIQTFHINFTGVLRFHVDMFLAYFSDASILFVTTAPCSLGNFVDDVHLSVGIVERQHFKFKYLLCIDVEFVWICKYDLLQR